MKKIKLFIIALAMTLFIMQTIASATVITPKGNKVETEATLTTRYAYNVDGNLEYIGKAESGTTTNEAGWFIQKIGYDANDNFASILNANGQPDFDKVWDNRESYTYE